MVGYDWQTSMIGWWFKRGWHSPLLGIMNSLSMGILFWTNPWNRRTEMDRGFWTLLIRPWAPHLWNVESGNDWLQAGRDYLISMIALHQTRAILKMPRSNWLVHSLRVQQLGSGCMSLCPSCSCTVSKWRYCFWPGNRPMIYREAIHYVLEWIRM